MTTRTRLPEAVVLAGGLLFVDLLLGWHRASVSVAGVVDVSGSTSAWNGWGAFAGVLVVALVVWEALRLRGSSLADRVGGEVTACLLAVGGPRSRRSSSSRAPLRSGPEVSSRWM